MKRLRYALALILVAAGIAATASSGNPVKPKPAKTYQTREDKAPVKAGPDTDTHFIYLLN